MRIIGGKFGGRVVKLQAGLPVRPTTDKTKEALFNILGSRLDFEGLRVLDLCCGSGNISLEFVSRGAAAVTAVDTNRTVLAAMKANFAAFDFPDGKVVSSDLLKFIETTTDTFDIIFIDPPYAMPSQDTLLRRIFGRNLVAPDGWLILEHNSLKDFSHLPYFAFVRKYGTSSVSFFERDGEQREGDC